ncbi:hypothetical protein AZE42_13503 [Rhizopogon vesiculosus]|uniref:Winged helix-turn helix domain-containing protein n=1 Tax=Rhizopogon vesiculosus TaxID=180088 RepID=A0A1J8Q2K1_9AGAM|nr:hypothetical protein AZE42_13503 [Rhizopogon vesiculosus]
MDQVPHRCPGQPRTLNQQDLAFISSLLDASPSLFLNKIQEHLVEAQDVEVSIATLSRTLRRLAITHKRASKTASEQDELLCATWLAEYGHLPKEELRGDEESATPQSMALLSASFEKRVKIK